MKPPPLKQTSWADKGIIIDAFVAMHMRSEAASAPPKAQQQPQFDWSRMSPMTFAHVGQFVSESNVSGAWNPGGALNSSKSPVLCAARTSSVQFPLTPHKLRAAPMGCPRNRSGMAIFHVMPGLALCSSIMA